MSKKQQISKVLAVFLCFLMVAMSTLCYHKESPEYFTGSADKYITITKKQMHVILYGDLIWKHNKLDFANKKKQNLVLFPGLAEPSPNIYMKPLAASLQDQFNVIIIEPFGYGKSDSTDNPRTMKQIMKEMEIVLSELNLKNKPILVTHSMGGVYGLEFSQEHSNMIKGVISIDGSVAELSDIIGEELDYMTDFTKFYQKERSSYSTLEAFKEAIKADPAKYMAEMPVVNGYTYSDADVDEWFTACANNFNVTIANEIAMGKVNLAKTKGEKFSKKIPVLMLISSNNVGYLPAWKTAHENQLYLNSENHKLYVVEGSHYIWYTSLSEMTEFIKYWSFHLK